MIIAEEAAHCLYRLSLPLGVSSKYLLCKAGASRTAEASVPACTSADCLHDPSFQSTNDSHENLLKFPQLETRATNMAGVGET